MKASRRLARVGAIAVKNSVYVLPRSQTALERLQWVRREVASSGRHEQDRCTFEVRCARLGLQEPRLADVPKVVHDIDSKDGEFGFPETAGVAALIAGLCRTASSDEERIEQGVALFDRPLAHFAGRRTISP